MNKTRIEKITEAEQLSLKGGKYIKIGDRWYWIPDDPNNPEEPGDI